MLSKGISGGYSLSCLHRTLRSRFLQRSWLSSMQQAQGENSNRNRKRSLHRQSAAQPPSAGPPGFDSLHLRDGNGMPPQGQPGQKQARRMHSSHRAGMVNAVAGLETDVAQAPPGSNARTSSTTRAHLTDVHFADLAICSATKRALSELLKYDLCTTVQAQSIPPSLQGIDLVCKAKTGTGKTIAFLIPALEQMKATPSGKISALIISPTRELASQIAVEAQALGKFHNITVQCVVGGTNMDSEIKRMKRTPPHILVATPGRLVDHLQNQGASQFMSKLDTLVFDEADRLLDMGFRPDVEKVLGALPDKATRQTLLFSATFPQDIQQLAQFAMKPGFQLIDTVGEDSTHSSSQVQQSAMLVPMAQMPAQLLHILAEHRASDPSHKVLVFFTTAKLTQMYAEVCNAAGIPVLEIHSRKSQSHRTRVAGLFREGTGLTMFTSDVSARGVDYPDVTLVLQVGMPADQAQYIHRVGRTARAGKQGQALLLLHDFERFFLRHLAELPVTQIQPTPVEDLADAEARAQQGLASIPETSKTSAYQAWLGFYNSYKSKLRWTATELVQQANYFSQTIGCDEPPAIEKKTIGKMGLKGTPGLRFAVGESRGGQGGRGGGNGGGRGGQNGGGAGQTAGRGGQTQRQGVQSNGQGAGSNGQVRAFGYYEDSLQWNGAEQSAGYRQEGFESARMNQGGQGQGGRGQGGRGGGRGGGQSRGRRSAM
ncbi:hypothetical protein ABBQ32_010052 [Trebouxia sp. C0010 RCD-2024]